MRNEKKLFLHILANQKFCISNSLSYYSLTFEVVDVAFTAAAEKNWVFEQKYIKKFSLLFIIKFIFSFYILKAWVFMTANHWNYVEKSFVLIYDKFFSNKIEPKIIHFGEQW